MAGDVFKYPEEDSHLSFRTLIGGCDAFFSKVCCSFKIYLFQMEIKAMNASPMPWLFFRIASQQRKTAGPCHVVGKMTGPAIGEHCYFPTVELAVPPQPFAKGSNEKRLIGKVCLSGAPWGFLGRLFVMFEPMELEISNIHRCFHKDPSLCHIVRRFCWIDPLTLLFVSLISLDILRRTINTSDCNLIGQKSKKS